MERGNSKHGPRLDEQMSHEVNRLLHGGAAGTRAEDWHDPEPSGEDQPDLAELSAQERRGAPPGMEPGEIEQRSRLGRYIQRSRLPADRAALLASAHETEAPTDVVEQLSALPEGQRYETVAQVWAALGHHNESRRT